jgi:hypothetical protein
MSSKEEIKSNRQAKEMKFLRGDKSCTMHDQIENKNMREKLNTFSVTHQAEIKTTGKSASNE